MDTCIVQLETLLHPSTVKLEQSCLDPSAGKAATVKHRPLPKPGTLMVSGLTWLWVSLRREMELWLRPPTTAISVLKFCSCSSFWKANREGRRYVTQQPLREEGRGLMDSWRLGTRGRWAPLPHARSV